MEVDTSLCEFELTSKHKLEEAIRKAEHGISFQETQGSDCPGLADLSDIKSVGGLKSNMQLDLDFSMPACSDDDVNEDALGPAAEDALGPAAEEAKSCVSPVVEKATNSLLRKTISQLQRALKDTEKLLNERDNENSKVRSQLFTAEKKLETYEDKNNSFETRLSEKDKIIKNLEDRIRELQDEIVSLADEIKNYKKEKRKLAKGKCCNSAIELRELRTKITEQEKRIEELKRNNVESASLTQAVVPVDQTVDISRHSSCRFARKEKDLQTQLRMKFMRDAFFYYMIDFHADEQLKAILAILEYEDKRSDIIYESHKMRQLGRRFTVSKVSSRGLTFVQEEIQK